MPKYVVKLTYEEALYLGIVYCKCGHPPNNHFDIKDRPCAHCSCKKMEIQFRHGKPIKERTHAKA